MASRSSHHPTTRRNALGNKYPSPEEFAYFEKSSATSPMCRKRTAPTFLTVAASRRLKAVRGPAQLQPRGGGKKTTTRRERAGPTRVKTREISENPAAPC